MSFECALARTSDATKRDCPCLAVFGRVWPCLLQQGAKARVTHERDTSQISQMTAVRLAALSGQRERDSIVLPL
jgi:hypothetical protein